jgi:ribonuclease III
LIDSYVMGPVSGIDFRDKTLLQRALTHRSYLNEHGVEVLEDNERLEFLGDAVLSLITARYLYHRFPEYREGELTRLRALLVRRETLAHFAQLTHLDQHLLLGRGEEESGGRSRPAVLCDVFEAFIGALYLDQGFGATERFVEPLMLGVLDDLMGADLLVKDARSELQELSQARFQVTPRYRTVHESGPDHAKEFVVEILVGGLCFGRGRGASKQSASQRAAADALSRLVDYHSLEAAMPLSNPDSERANWA